MLKRTVPDAPGFDLFWSGFLRREKKQAARDAFRWAMQNHNEDGKLLERILETLEWQRVVTPDRQFWTTPDRWLLGMRWEDEKPLTAEEQAQMAQFRTWQQANAHDEAARTVTFDMFQRYAAAQRRRA
jgi:hypothetical protein